MGIELSEGKQKEVMITRVTIINPNIHPVAIPNKYRCLFHGESVLRYGRHVFRFPITNIDYKRLISSFQADFKGRVTVDFGSSGFEEV